MPMPTQQSPDLFIDGNIAQMFRPEGAAAYFARLLHVDLRSLRFIPSPEWTTAFLICSPQVPQALPFTIAHGHPAWLLDFAIRPIGTVVQQRIWAPQNAAQRLAHAPLNVPIFFVLNDNVTLGLPIVTAAARDHMTLRGAGTPAPVGECSTTFIRINWPGYSEWSSQIMTRDQTPAHNTITVEKFAKRVASAVCRFIDASRMEDQGREARWRIGPGAITRDDVIIIGVVNVTQESWQPILQLGRYVV
ncbi:hypothetical protein V8E53_000396 [Lactarius tabidus]